MIPFFRLGSKDRALKKRVFRCGCELLESRIVLNSGAVLPALVAGAPSSTDEDTPSVVSAAAGVSYPGGVTVTATQIITQEEVIPRFAATPTITAARSGNWNDPTMWAQNRVPGMNDRVSIGSGITVNYATVSDASINSLEISGSLLFSTTVNTRLKVGNLTVMPTGTLQVGTPSQPVAPQVTAEIVIADQPLNLTLDPKQYGTGLIALGTVTMHGSTLAQTWTRLAAEPKAGDRVLRFASVDPAWQPGDMLILPDTRQVRSSDDTDFYAGNLDGQWEQVMILGVVGNQVVLLSPLKYDHLGAHNADGGLELLPHVANLDRNVVIRSENPQGTRGHTFYTARATVDIEYTRFQDLGRTDAFRNLDSTTLDASGNVTHIGTNQIGRYAVHFHHLMGPENPTNTGYQYKFIGNTVDGSRKWAVAVHDTDYGLLDQNVIYDAQGAGFVTEDGSEVFNVFSNNITIRIMGTGIDGKSGTAVEDYGRGGSGFWFHRGGNTVSGNVAADSFYAGYVIDGYNDWDELSFPLYRGANKHEAGQGYTTELNPPTTFTNNEAYGWSTFGLWAAYISGNNLVADQPETLFYDLRLWNTLNAAIQGYHTNRMTFDHLLILGSVTAQNRNDTGSAGMSMTIYENQNLVVRNSRIEGMRIGVMAPRSDASTPGVERPTIIQDTILKNYINVMVSPATAGGPGNGNSLELRNVKFIMTPNLPDGPAHPDPNQTSANICMVLLQDRSDLTQPSVVRVYNYNQVPGDNFQVLYREQAYNYPMPQTDPSLLDTRTEGLIGSPVGGLPNLLNWNMFQIATAGMPALPTFKESRPEIEGLVGPIFDMSKLCAARRVRDTLGKRNDRLRGARADSLQRLWPTARGDQSFFLIGQPTRV